MSTITKEFTKEQVVGHIRAKLHAHQNSTWPVSMASNAQMEKQVLESALAALTAPPAPVVPDGWMMVPIEPTEHMIVEGFESEPDEDFSNPEVWEAYQAMSGCQQAAHRAKLCWTAMINAAPKMENV